MNYKNALHDCNLAFNADLQEADMGLVYYYKDEIIEALRKQIPKPMEVVEPYSVRCSYRYYCPVCRKQQKLTYKNMREGCYCERCGQLLEPTRGEGND